MEKEKIINEAAAAGIILTPEQALLFQRYFNLIMLYNQKFNLTRIVAEDEVLEEHFIEPLLAFAKGRDFAANRLLDLGAGAGFPGIPLKIYLPGLDLILLDSSHKKTLFLQTVLLDLCMEEATVLCKRAEDYGRGEGRGMLEWVAARAFAPLNIALEIALPLLKPGGYFWAFKGPNYKEELTDGEEILSLCGGRLEKIKTYTLPHSQKERFLLIFKKTAETDKRFPRRAGIPQKRPYLKSN